MKLKEVNINKIIMVILGLVLFISIIVFLLSFNSSSSSVEKKGSLPSPSKVNISKIVSKIKEENGVLEYESSKIPGVVSLVFNENNRYKNILIDTNTGKKLEFSDLIKADKWNDFLNKEEELLKLKYPKFIVDGLNTSDGLKIYYVKDSELIIFYYDYTFMYPYEDIISLKIDYNEIKDYLKIKPALNETYEREDGYNYSTNKKTIALTFDDGPSGKYNPLILKELEDNKAHATFFMVGKNMNYCQSCVLNTVKKGNEVGSHTYEHINIKNSDINKVNESLNKTNEIYKKITGSNIKYLRPPYGAYNKTNLDNINNPLVLWNLDTEDWRYRDVDRIVNYVKENISDGSIILMHELYETSYEALKEILPWAYASGYQVVSVSELAKLKGRTLESGKAYRSIR